MLALLCTICNPLDDSNSLHSQLNCIAISKFCILDDLNCSLPIGIVSPISKVQRFSFKKHEICLSWL